jgi:heme-degrading monooxygenase HmoA
VLTHIVLFKLKDRSPEVIAETKRVLQNMEGKIPQLLSIEVGSDVLHSERSYDIALVTRFESLQAMQEYQVHPLHQEVAAYLATVREAAVAVDYES